jgi:hypothetical protein
MMSDRTGAWSTAGASTFSRVSTSDFCAQLIDWYEQYPSPSAPADQNAAARGDEDTFLARFSGLAALDRSQVAALIGWKFQSMPHRKTLAMRGISPERWDGHDGAAGAADLIRKALASTDDHEALATMANGAGGIHRFGPAMSSVVLAACRPQRFTIADSRALKTLRKLDRMPPGPPGFQLGDWLPYLNACRVLAGQCGLSLRQVDRALWIGTSDPALAA